MYRSTVNAAIVSTVALAVVSDASPIVIHNASPRGYVYGFHRRYSSSGNPHTKSIRSDIAKLKR